MLTIRGQFGAHRLRGVGKEGEEEEGRERGEVQAGNGRDQAAENVEEGVSHHKQGLEDGLPGHLREGGKEGGREGGWNRTNREKASTYPPSFPSFLLPALPPALPGHTWGNHDRRMRPVSTML